METTDPLSKPNPNILPEERRLLNQKRLDAFAAEMLDASPHSIGYPGNQNTGLRDFYRWYFESGLYSVFLNNAGDAFHPPVSALQTHSFEKEVIDFFAPHFGFQEGYWGFVTASGTDGNCHGMYFGKKFLSVHSPLAPIVYVSADAHCSIRKLADLQGLELRLIQSDDMGRMDLDDFEAQLDPTRPALIVIALGTTFTGGIDNQLGINTILARVNPPAVYRHLDAALFGSILAFLPEPAKTLVNSAKMHFDSIALSGHKFWGMDEPAGVFLTSHHVLASLHPLHVEYMKDAVATISCSRNALAPLKLWWKINFSEEGFFENQAALLLQNAQYLYTQLQAHHIPAWLNEFSNTVFFPRPSPKIMDYYGLAPDKHKVFGDVAHVVVMPHVTPGMIDRFVADMTTDFAGDR